MYRLILSLIGLALGSASGGPVGIVVAKNGADPLPVNDAIRVKYFGEYSPVVLSPNGKVLAYVIRGPYENVTDLRSYPRTGVPISAIGGNIYIRNLETGQEVNLTGNKGDNWRPTWSPDGRYLAFLSDRDGSGQARLWGWDSIKNALTRISDIDVRGDGIEWTPDGQRVLFTTLPKGLSIDDYVRRFRSVGDDQTPETNHTPSSTVDLFRAVQVSQIINKSSTSNPWSLNWALRDLALAEVGTGKTTLIVRGRRIAKYELSSDGTHIAYTTPVRFERRGAQQTLFDIVSVDMATSEDKIIAFGVRLGLAGEEFSWSPNANILSYRTVGREDKGHDCYVVDITTGVQRNITALPGQASRYMSGAPLWSRAGDRIYFVDNGTLWQANTNQNRATLVSQIPNHTITRMIAQSSTLLWTAREGNSTVVITHNDLTKEDGFYRIDLNSGESTTLLEDGRCYTCAVQDNLVAVSKDGQRLAFYAESADRSPDIWVSDSSFRQPQRATHLNPQFDKYKMGTARLIDWLSDDGERLHGALLLPPGYQKSMRYPLLVWVYGGSSLSDRFNHFGLDYSGPFNMQLEATRGYAVLLPDSPQHVGTPMLDLAKTVLPGVNKVIEMGIADPDRIGVMGHSNGGYSTLSLIVQTKRFKAAVDIDGMGDLIAGYGEMNNGGTAFATSNLEHGQDALGGSPWEVRHRYIENSPIYYLDRVETPLLIVHGSQDQVVGSFLADQVFVGLRRLGKEVEYARYSGEGHSPLYWSYANQVDLCERMIAWFDKHLGSKRKETH
jgi:dipeptidyl aminopeptidase/acylaminoacyl peptidase